MNKKNTLILIIISFLVWFVVPVKIIAVEPCSVPDSVGTLSVGSDSVAVRWHYNNPVPSNYKFQMSYAEESTSFGLFEPSPAILGNIHNYDYDYTFTNLSPDTTYYWKLRVSCDAGINNDILSGFITIPTLDITGFLFTDGKIKLKRRVQILSDFSYLRSPIWDVMTKSVGSGRLHIIDVY